MNNRLIEKIASLIVSKKKAHSIIARIINAYSDVHEISENSATPIKLVSGDTYFCSFNENQEIIIGSGKAKRKAVISGDCLFTVNDDNTINWEGGSWEDGSFFGSFSNGVFNGGKFNGNSFSDSVFNTGNAKYSSDISTWKDGNKDTNGNALDRDKINIVNGYVFGSDDEIVSKPCDKEDFSGMIFYKSTKATVKNATFSLRENDIVWNGGEVVEGKISMQGQYSGFSGSFGIGDARFKAVNASFNVSVNAGRTVIVWNGGDWLDGTWSTGIWNKGVWHDGTWRFGNWISSPQSKWIKGKDRNGVEHVNSPDNWQMAINKSSHALKDHTGRYDFLDSVLIDPNSDNTVFGIWYQEENQYGKSMNVLYNSGLYVCYSLDNPMLNSMDELNASTKIPHLLNAIQRNVIGLDLERQLLRDSRFDRMVEALDFKEDEDGKVSVVPLLKPRPVGMELPRHLKEKALLSSLQECYNATQMDSIIDFKSNPIYKQVWDRKVNEISSMSDEEFLNLYDEVLALEHTYVFICKPKQRNGVWNRFSNARERGIMANLLISNGFFKDVDEINRFSKTKEVRSDLEQKYRALMNGRQVWK